MRVIIIDDSKDFMATLRRALAHVYPDIEVTEFDAEQQGKPPEDFDWSLYELVFIDQQLDMDDTGVDWFIEFRGRPGFPQTIILASEGDEYAVVKAVKLGASGFLKKSDVETPRLGEVVAEALADRTGPCEETQPPKLIEHDARIVARAASRFTETPDGARIGYRFVRLIGQGATSRVYLAERVSDRITLVLKIIDVDMITEPLVLKRFVQEAELVSDLDSPYVVRFHDHGFTHDYGYIAMEFFTRGDLKQRLEHGMGPEEALNYCLHIAYGLEAIHELGIVHRDLKPGNIMFRSDDSLALADFGISKRLDLSSEITNAGSILGTPNYISPEQAQGHTVDARSDLYSAGVILFEMLSGRKAFRAETPTAVLYQHVHAQVPRLPPHVEIYQNLIDRLLAKRPEERYQSASELVVNLQAAARRAARMARSAGP